MKLLIDMFFSLKKDSRTRGHEVKLVKDQCRLRFCSGFDMHKQRAVLDVGLLSLHDLRADSLIRPIDSRSVIQLLSNHCHFNNHIFSAYFFYLA